MLEVQLKPGRDRSLERRHPWVMSGAVARVVGGSGDDAGAWTRVRAADGRVLGHGHYSPASSIRVRLLAFGETDPGEEILDERIARAVERRARHPLLADTDAMRLVNAEGDWLPGLTVDRYADFVVARLTSAGMFRRREAVAAALRKTSGARAGWARADARTARREGIPQQEGALWGELPAGPVRIWERGREYEVDLLHGQKTGFYLDQREARDLVECLSRGRRVLDLFSYSGGFAVAAARGGAREVVLVDSSQDALDLAARNLARNAPDCPTRLVRGDAFEQLRAAAAGSDLFDLLVLDPPPLARHKGDVPRASRAYKDLLIHALRRGSPGASLLAFSCSHHVGPELFGRIVFGAAHDAGCRLQVVRELGAGADHPVSVDHPEGRYLHGVLLELGPSPRDRKGTA